ncbi:MAG: methylenetetrahydrofolate reductase C-terminal domain-containing protein [Pseudomonadota bacterium]
MFGCQQCGQCLLSQTGYVCPMTCPKGLRNGPCGGTLDGACEVFPDRPCVWLRIDSKTEPAPGLHQPFDPALVETSSLGNFVSGRDRSTRLVKTYRPRPGSENDTPSVLAQRFESAAPVVTYEIASPRKVSGLERVAATVEAIRGIVDGINTTTNAGGIPSLHSLETARVVAANGIPPIVQFCGRDQNADEFRDEIAVALNDGFANILALTGDWNPNTERNLSSEYWFPMDSLQMVDLLASHNDFVKRPFIGVASNPYTTPISASLDRLNAKLQAGADFTQTQAVTETAVFGTWLAAVRKLPGGERLRVLPSVPLIGKPRPLEILKNLAGVRLDPGFASQLERPGDLANNGLAAALTLIRELLQMDIDGIHLMNFGVPVSAVIDVVSTVKEEFGARQAVAQHG